MLATGLEQTTTGEAVKMPDREVQDRLTLIFQTMLQQRTAPKVMRVLRAQNLLIPRRARYGDLQWRPPTTGQIINALRHSRVCRRFRLRPYTHPLRKRSGDQAARLPAGRPIEIPGEGQVSSRCLVGRL